MECDVIKLTKESQSYVNAICGGQYVIQSTNCRMCASKYLAVGDLNPTVTINCDVDNLERVLVTYRIAGAIDVAGAFQTARINPKLTSMHLNIGGTNFPSQKILGGTLKTQNFLTETLSAFDMLHGSYPNKLNALGTATTPTVSTSIASSPYNFDETTGVATTANGSDSGSFCVAIKLNSLDESSHELYNGLSTKGLKTFLHTSHSAVSVPLICDVYCFYNTKLTLDMNGSQTWIVEE